MKSTIFCKIRLVDKVVEMVDLSNKIVKSYPHKAVVSLICCGKNTNKWIKRDIFYVNIIKINRIGQKTKKEKKYCKNNKIII